MSHIFISYNQSDADFAAVLSIQIEKAGIDTWMDKSRLRPGQDWSVEIDNAILSAHALVVVMSPEAKASEYVTYEWSFALGAGIQVIPVLYKETTLHPRLGRLHYLKFTDPSVRPWDALIETVKEAVEGIGLHAVSVPRNAPSHVRSAVLALDSANELDRRGAISVLAESEHPAAQEALLSALRHPIKDVRLATALRVTGDARAVPALVEGYLTGESGRSRFSEHLSNFGPAGMNALIELLATEDTTGIPAFARPVLPLPAQALSNFAHDDAVPLLLELLHDPDPKKRKAAALVLGYHTSDRVVGELRAALQDADENVRVAAITALGGTKYSFMSDEFGRDEVKRAEAILAGLRDSSPAVRAAAAFELNLIKDESFQKKFFGMLGGELPHIILRAYQTVRDPYYVKGLAALGILKKIDINTQPGQIIIHIDPDEYTGVGKVQVATLSATFPGAYSADLVVINPDGRVRIEPSSIIYRMSETMAYAIPVTLEELLAGQQDSPTSN